MLGAIVTILKIILVSVVIAIWISWIVILGQLMREHSWDSAPTFRLLSLLHPTIAKIVIGITYIIVGLIGTIIATVLLIIIL